MCWANSMARTTCWSKGLPDRKVLLVRRRLMHLLQAGQPLRPVDRSCLEARLQIAQHLAPSLVEVRIGLVPFASIAPPGVMKSDAGRLAIDIEQPYDHECSLRARLRQ